jgi:hypothetical protein
MNGWTGASEWKTLNGQLLSDGNWTHTMVNGAVAPTGGDTILSPYKPPTADFAVEARIQIISNPDNCWVAIGGRIQNDGSGYDGYFVGYDAYYGDGVIAYFSPGSGWTPMRSNGFHPGNDWHIYRAEFKGNQITLKIDGSIVLQIMDNRLLNAGRVGLENGDCQVGVSSFQVTAL